MRVVTILGSPRPQGNTARILKELEDLLEEKGHMTDRVNVVDHRIGGCLGCDACKKVANEPGCVQHDDVAGILDRIITSDAVVYATPLYTYGFTSQMKALIDREYCLVTGYGTPGYVSLLQGKPTALLVTCGGPIEENADLIQQAFDREGLFQRWDIFGKYIVPLCGEPDALGERATDTATKIARAIEATGRDR